MKNNKPETIDAYIADFPKNVQAKLQQVRKAILNQVPEATEAIKYAIPTFVYRGKNLVHFAGFQHHIGFYATPTGHEAFEQELSKYKQGKGSVQFPLERPMPLKLIERITKFRVDEMNKATKPTKAKASAVTKIETETVEQFLKTLEHPLIKEIHVLRKIISTANKNLTEHIKWNAPSFCMNGEDRITFKLHPTKSIQIIFHRGAKVKAYPKRRLIEEEIPFLKWPTNDRAIATFYNASEIKANKDNLTKLVNRWIDVTRL